MKISQGRTCTDIPMMLQNSIPAWNVPSSFCPHTFLAQTSSLLPVAPGVGQGLTSFGEVSTQNAAGLGYRLAGQSLSHAEPSWPRSQCGSTSGAHTSNLWGDMPNVSCSSLHLHQKGAEVCGWVLMEEAVGPASPPCPQHSLGQGGPLPRHSCRTDLGDLPPRCCPPSLLSVSSSPAGGCPHLLLAAARGSEGHGKSK